MKAAVTGRATQMVRAAATRIAPEFRSFSDIMGVVVFVIGAAVLVGWVTDNPTLKSLRPDFVSMKPNAALGFLFCAIALRAVQDPEMSDEWRWLTRRIAIAAIAIGILTLVEYALPITFGIDEILFRDSGNPPWTPNPGRMAPTAAVDFVLLGFAICLIDAPGRHRLVEVLTISALLVSLFAYLAHLHSLELLQATADYTPMAVHETAAFCLLSAGILTARPDRGLMAVISGPRASGRMARRLLPAAVAVPTAFAWLGFAGMRAGFYQSVFALGAVTVAIAVAMSAIVLWSAQSLEDLDLERERSEERRRKTDEAARKSAERFLWLVDGVRDYAMFLIDAQGFVQTWNLGAERGFGYQPFEVIGRPHSIFYTREDISAGKPQHALQIAVTEGQFEEESLRRRKDGAPFWAHVSITPLAGDDGKLRGFVHVSRDTSAQKQAAEELEKTNAARTSREQTLQQALAELARTHEELKNGQLGVLQNEKMESISRLAAGVAHEVKNPLAVIQSGIDYLSVRPDATGPAAEVLDEMQKAVLRATAILGGLVDFSAPRTLELAVADLNSIVDQAVGQVKHEVERNHVQVVQSLDEKLPPLQVDRRKLEQVFVNVMLNAIQAMPNGGTLSVNTYNARARTDAISAGSRTSPLLHPRERAVIVEISDTGTGIPPDHLRKIFEPFFTTKPTRKGTGLGLTLCKAIVDMHGGFVNVTNRKEGGVRVTIALATKGNRDGIQAAAAAD